MASLPAGSVGNISGCVHLPPCSTPACQSFLQQVQTTLQQHNISCIASYEPGGLYQDRFEQAFGQSSCTIVHICPQLLSKVKRVETVLKREPGKAWFVQTQPHTIDTDLEFLLDFNIVDICTQDEQSKFLKELVSRLGNGDAGKRSAGSKTPRAPELSAARHPPPTTIPTSDGDGFHCFPMVLRAGVSSALHVNKLFFNLDSLQCTGVSVEELVQGSHDIEDQAYLSQVILPDLHAKGELVSLAHVACSHLVHLRLQALHLIISLLLEQSPGACSRETLEKVEDILFTAVGQQYRTESRHETDFVREHLDCTEFLAICYLTLVAVYILRMETAHSRAFLQAVLQRPLFQMKRPGSLKNLLKPRSSQHSGLVPGWYKAIKACLTEWNAPRACEEAKLRVWDTVHSSRGTTDPQSPWHKVTGWRLGRTLLLLVASLVKSFKDSKPVFLPFLEKFRPKMGVRVRETDTTLQRIITSLLIFGLSSFLQDRAEKLSSYDSFLQVCGQSIDWLDKVVSALDKPSQVICNFHMTPLLFNANKTIRQHTGVLLRRQSFYHEHLWELLLLETALIMWPLLGFTDTRPDKDASSHQSWIVVQSTFNKHNVQTHSHRSTGTHHLRHNRTEDKSILHHDQYFRELGFLKELKHANVLQLVAFHDTCCPQFYITEDYVTSALQSVLVNKSRNGHQFPLKRLLMFLVEALKGIQYCHDKNIVHRDLTAANIFIIADEKVKLAGFKHALRLSGKQYIKDFDLLFMATRWSAPESHQHCCFSLASDMWMVGRLMYEVLTHGRLPYADVPRPDEQLMPMVVRGEKTLCNESCIPGSLQQVIQQLSSIRDVQRTISAQDVGSRLQEILHSAEWSESLCHYFPDLRSDEQAATKHAKGPVLSLIDEYPGITLFAHEANDEEEEASGYVNCGPKKGPVHFVEPCPDSFTTEEWTTLSQEDLPLITKLIGRPAVNSSGQKMLPFMVAARSLCSLKDTILFRWLGKDLEPYVLCLWQLASDISYLHSRRIILRDFAADTIQVEKPAEDIKAIKVWVTSLPLVKVLPEASEPDLHVDLHRPQNGDERRRAAPEVLLHGQYSPSSDVYCFGMLIWWVFNAFDLSSTGGVQTPDELSPLNRVPINEVYENIAEGLRNTTLLPRPDCCPQHIYDLIKECLQAKICRPRMDKLRRYLTLDRSEIAGGEDGYEPIMSVANASEETDSLSGRRSSILSLGSIGIPSEVTDTDLEDEDIYMPMDSDEECYSDLSMFGDVKESDMFTSTVKDEKYDDGVAVQEHLSHGRDEQALGDEGAGESPFWQQPLQHGHGNVYANTPPPLPPRNGYGKNSQNGVEKSGELMKLPWQVSEGIDVDSDAETYDYLDRDNNVECPDISSLTVEDGKRSDGVAGQADSSSRGGDEHAYRYRDYTNTPPPLPPRNIYGKNSQNDMEKSEELLKLPCLASDSQSLSSLSDTSSNLQNSSKGEMQNRSQPPPLPSRCFHHEKKGLGKVEIGQGLPGHRGPVLPPTPPLPGQNAFDAKQLPPLLPATGPDSAFSVPAPRADKAGGDTEGEPQQQQLPPSQPPHTDALSTCGDDTLVGEQLQVPPEPAAHRVCGSFGPASAVVAVLSGPQGARANETMEEGKEEKADTLQGAEHQSEHPELSSAFPGSSALSSSKHAAGAGEDGESSDDDLHRVVFV